MIYIHSAYSGRYYTQSKSLWIGVKYRYFCNYDELEQVGFMFLGGTGSNLYCFTGTLVLKNTTVHLKLIRWNKLDQSDFETRQSLGVPKALHVNTVCSTERVWP